MLKIRNLAIEDVDQVIPLYNQLTPSTSPTNEFINQFFSTFTKTNNAVFIGELNNKIIGSVTVLIELKLTHGGSKVAHIEEVVIDKQFRNQGYGKLLLQKAIKYAEQQNCYKLILDCGEDVKGFYVHCGMEQKGLQMAKYFK